MRPWTELFVCVALLVFVMSIARPAESAPGARPAVQHDHGTAPTPPAAEGQAGPAAPASARAPEAEIDRLLQAMNVAEGEAKVAAMAELVTRLVAERRAPADASAPASCPMCAAKMAARPTPNGTPPAASGHVHKGAAAAVHNGCGMMAHK
jgi:hypothetical protein